MPVCRQCNARWSFRDLFCSITRSIRNVIAIAGVIAGATATDPAGAEQAYPSHAVKIIVPFPPGGSFDGIPRVVAQKIATLHGWQSFVENRPGADGAIALGAARRAEADGYTLVAISSITHGSVPALKQNPGYDALKDFVPIVLLGEAAMTLQVRKGLPVHTVAEFVALLKAQPGKLTFGSGGTSSQHYFTVAMLFQRAGLPLDIAAHVPFPGIAAGLQELVAGNIDFMVGTSGTVAQFIESGQISAIASTGRERLVRMPTVPTIAEAGYPGFHLVTWVGLAAPAGTPPDIIEQWSRYANEALQVATIRGRIEAFDYEPRGGTPAEFAAYSAADIAQYRKLVDDLALPRR